MPIPTLLIKGSIKSPALKNNAEIVPVEFIIDHIKNKLASPGINNRILLLRSETASGKSTTIPAEIFINIVSSSPASSPGIICTQPRTITAIRNVAEIVFNAGPSYPNYLKIGQTIGWSTKYNKLRPVEKRGLTSATIGTLTMQLKSMSDTELMDMYKFIIIDEVHERDLQIDMALYMLKKFLIRNANNPKCPMLIAMSATFDPTPFANYFGVSLEDNYIYVGGASQGHREMWDWNEGRISKHYTKDAARVVDIICRGEGANDTSDEADILIFMPGALEFTQVEANLIAVRNKLHDDGLPVFSILPIDAESQRKELKAYKMLDVPVANQQVIIADKKLVPNRRVIIATNMAETGLTLPNLKYVIDSGYNREVEFNPNHGVRALLTKPAPESRRNQRRGRAGRKFPGVFYPLYPKYIQERLPAQQLPQILTEDISPIMLDVIGVTCDAPESATTADAIIVALKNGELDHRPFKAENIDMLDVPTSDSFGAAFEKLYALGFIDFDGDRGHKLTKLGYLARRFNQISPENIRMILAAWAWRCDPRDLITIAAYVITKAKTLTVKKTNIEWRDIYTKSIKLGTPHFSGEDLPHALFRSQIIIADSFIEGVILFNAASTVKPDQIRKWCESHNISFDGLMLFYKTRDDIISQCITAGLDVFNVSSRGGGISLENVDDDTLTDYITRLKYCIYDGYRLNMIKLDEAGNYKSRTGLTVKCPQLWEDNVAAKRAKLAEGINPDIRPKILLYDELGMKYNQKTNLYEVICEHVSVMDGYIAYDEYFCN